MYRLLVVSLLIGACHFFSDCAGGQSPKLPVELLSIDGVKTYVDSEGISSIERLMEQLPDVLLNNYVLMEDSQSRQRPSTTSKPRIIMFLPDGSFFMGVATNEDSAGYYDVEMLESVASDQTWKLGAVRLEPDRDRFLHSAGKRVGERRGCTGCHGDNSRPIWGSYPTWPGAFANGAAIEVTATQAMALNEALDTSSTNSNLRLQKLNWVKRVGWTDGDSLNLPDRHRGLNNEAMNDAVGARHVENLWKRIKREEHFELLMLTAMFHRSDFGDGSTGVGGSGVGIPEIKVKLAETLDEMWDASGLDFPRANLRDKVLLLLGLMPYNDLFLSKGLHQLSDPEREQTQIAYWNYIAIYLGDFFVVRFTEHLLKERPELEIGQSMLQSSFEYDNSYPNIFAYYRDNVRFMWELDLSERVEVLRIRSAPTVDLRYNDQHLFTRAFRIRITPKLIEFAEQKIAEYEAP